MSRGEIRDGTVRKRQELDNSYHENDDIISDNSKYDIIFVGVTMIIYAKPSTPLVFCELSFVNGGVQRKW